MTTKEQKQRRTLEITQQESHKIAVHNDYIFHEGLATVKVF